MEKELKIILAVALVLFAIFVTYSVLATPAGATYYNHEEVEICENLIR